MPKILLTGGSGFIGSSLLKNDCFKDVLAIGRTRPENCKNFYSVELDSEFDLTNILNDVDIIVHVAAKAHVMDKNSNDTLDDYRRINTLATLRLAKQAIKAGVKRFIFISTIKVLGDETIQNSAFTFENRLNPKDSYSISKAEAEIGLEKAANFSNMEFVIIRPPLVYGHGVKGNFASLLKLVSLPVPLPFGAIDNRRSLVSVENLVDLICTCLDHPNAKNQTFLVSDDWDMSTPDLCRLLAKTGGYNPHIFRFPETFLRMALYMIGKNAVYKRLSGSMEVDIEHTKSCLNWKPPFKVKDTVANCWTYFD